MREGVARDGSHLFPAFPYYAYTKLSDDDVKALYAYLMTRPAVSATARTNTVQFPLKIRALAGRLEASIFQERTVSDRSLKKRPMESRSISGGGRRGLLGLSHCSKFSRCGKDT